MPLIFVWEVLGGLGLFILGMKSMSEGLQKLAGERLRRSLEKVTGNRLTAALMGSCLASLLQSSSAASILVIGFVNAGLISVYQALGVLLGTGLGTTLAIQFIAFKISYFALPAIFIGVLLTFSSKKRKLVYLGNLLLGAGLIFLGLQIMEAGFSPISQNDLLRGLQNQLLSGNVSAMLVGALLAFILQSGSAATGLVIAMAGTGLIGYETGVAIIIGEILGTSLVAVTATINGSLAAKRTAYLYLFMSAVAVFAALLCFPFFLKAINSLSPGPADLASGGLGSIPGAAAKPYIARHLANAHTLFNLGNVLLFLPLVGFLARSAPAIMPGRAGGLDFEPRPIFIDSRVLNTPTIALLQAKNELKRMADISRVMYEEIVAQFYRYDAKKAAAILQKRGVLNVLQHEISSFLILLSRQSLSPEKSVSLPIMLHMITDLKHIGDQSYALMELLRRKKEDKITFSAAAMNDLKTLAAMTAELVNAASEAVDGKPGIDPQEAVKRRGAITAMLEDVLNSHMARLTAGRCTVAAGMSFSDILSGFGKIAEYASSLLEMERELDDEVSTSGN